MSSNIKWKQSDYVKMGIKVSKFNKKINSLGNLSYLPNKLDYKKMKTEILTRAEYNRQLREIDKFLEEGAEELYITKSGEKITKWENQKLINETRIAKRRLNKELAELEKPLDTGFSPKQMGYIEYQEILAQVRNIQKLEEKQGYEFTKLKNRISNIGRLDYEEMQATIFRQNFMKAFEEAYQNFTGYSYLKSKFENVRSSRDFYKLIKKSNVFMDIFVYYKNSEDSYGGFDSPQDRFFEGIDDFEFIEQDKDKLRRKYQRKLNNKRLSEKQKTEYKNKLNEIKNINNSEELIYFLEEE